MANGWVEVWAPRINAAYYVAAAANFISPLCKDAGAWMLKLLNAEPLYGATYWSNYLMEFRDFPGSTPEARRLLARDETLEAKDEEDAKERLVGSIDAVLENIETGRQTIESNLAAFDCVLAAVTVASAAVVCFLPTKSIGAVCKTLLPAAFLAGLRLVGNYRLYKGKEQRAMFLTLRPIVRSLPSGKTNPV